MQMSGGHLSHIPSILRDALRAPQDEGDRMTVEIKACLTHPVTPQLLALASANLMNAIYTVKCIKGPEYNARGPGSALRFGRDDRK